MTVIKKVSVASLLLVIFMNPSYAISQRILNEISEIKADLRRIKQDLEDIKQATYRQSSDLHRLKNYIEFRQSLEVEESEKELDR